MSLPPSFALHFTEPGLAISEAVPLWFLIRYHVTLG